MQERPESIEMIREGGNPRGKPEGDGFLVGRTQCRG
jgi:hypothetical protein